MELAPPLYIGYLYFSINVLASFLVQLPAFIFSIISLRDYSFNENINWLKQPINCILITLMLTSVLYHSSLGLQVVIEDYIHDIKIRKFLMVSPI